MWGAGARGRGGARNWLSFSPAPPLPRSPALRLKFDEQRRGLRQRLPSRDRPGAPALLIQLAGEAQQLVQAARGVWQEWVVEHLQAVDQEEQAAERVGTGLTVLLDQPPGGVLVEEAVAEAGQRHHVTERVLEA